MLQIYKASAGSGKTHNLTREYIKYLLAEKGIDGKYRLRRHPSSDHSRILAITFTNKATNEMTRRIIKELAVLACMATPQDLAESKISPEDAHNSTVKSPYFEDFTDPVTGLGCNAEQLRDAARVALTNLLFDYSYFNVSTIDSFFQTVLRMFTREVELPDNYNVELDSNSSVTIGVDEMLNSLNTHTIPGTPEDVKRKWVSNWLFDFMHEYMLKGGKFNLFSKSSKLYSALVSELRIISNEEFKNRRDKLSQYFKEPERLKRFANGLQNSIQELRNQLQQQCSELITVIPEDAFTSNFLKALKKLAKGEPLSSDKTMYNVVEEPSKAVKATAVKKYNISADLTEHCADVASLYVLLAHREKEFAPLLDRVYIFGLLSTVENYIEEYCRENSLIQLNDTNDLLKGLINDDETPFIYEKLGFYLDHFLIDEFQDTSTMQWENLRPLVMESLGRGKDDLIIGDEKQCIYRFRNSDPQLLGETVERDTRSRFIAHSNTVDVKGVDIKDNCNWRSAPEIIKFNNTLYSALAGIIDAEAGNTDNSLSAKKTYANIVQQIDPRRNATPGYVKITIGTDPDDQMNSNEAALDLMAREIKRQIKAGYSPTDIAVLVRDNKAGSTVIKYLLSLMNNPGADFPHFDILSEEVMTLDSSKAIRLIISVLRLVSLPEFLDKDHKAEAQASGQPIETKEQSDTYRRARLLNRYQFYLSRKHPDGTPFSTSEALDAALEDNRSDSPAASQSSNDDELRSLLDMDSLNLPSVIERIIHAFVPNELRVKDNIFLSTFQDTVYDFTQQSNYQDIKSFLTWWDRSGHKTSIASPPGSNALTVITVHKAKGLEYKCVHIPFANDELYKTLPAPVAWIDLPAREFEKFGIDPDDVPPAMPLKISLAMTSSEIYGPACADIIARSMVDELNVNYVAMTRPTAELIVSSPYTRRKTFRNYLLDAVMLVSTDYIDRLDVEPDVKKWIIPLVENFDGVTFTYGSPTSPKKPVLEKGKEESESFVTNVPMEQYDTHSFTNVITANTRIDDIDPFDPNNVRHVGDFLHSVMSLVTTPAGLDSAMRRQAYRFHIDQTLASRYKARLEKALSNPLAHKWFTDFQRVITERAVTSRNNTRRPDRIVWLPDGSVNIIDYKFVDTLPTEFNNNNIHQKYIKQVTRYCRYIKQCNNTANVKGFIWYIAPYDNIIKPI